MLLSKLTDQGWDGIRKRTPFLRPRGRYGRPPKPIGARQILNIRWLALVGQLAALLFTYFILEFDIPIGGALFVIGLGVAMNVFQARRTMIMRDQPDQSFIALTFDVLQLSGLLFFTGGLLNPFVVLLLAPVAVSAVILERRETLILIVLVACCVSFVALFHYPLPWDASNIRQSGLYLVGLWLSMVLSVFFIGIYAWWLSSRARRLDEALGEARLVLAKEQQAVALGTLATAAAHRLGSPLNTITVIVHEMMRDIDKQNPLHEDVMLLRSEAERCRLILAELDDYGQTENMDAGNTVPLSVLIDEIAKTRMDIGALIIDISLDSRSAMPMPAARRRPEIIHALEDLLKNAVEFAKTRVDVTIRCTISDVTITISDDGPGFAGSVLSRVGAPWNTSRQGKHAHRGLGIFIASNLIETLGGSILYNNGDQGGGEVVVLLPMEAFGS